MIPSGSVLIALLLTMFSGLSTGIGSGIALLTKRTNTKFLSASLGFSAGVMIYVSFVELFSDGCARLGEIYGNNLGNLYGTLAFFGGILLIALIDKFIPTIKNPHEIHGVEEMHDDSKILDKSKKNASLNHVGIMTALAIGIHNFPEGMATFTSALMEPTLGVAIAIAIAIHNIPEGIAVSVPIYFATGNRKKAFWLSFMSGLAEPLGALVAYLILMPFLTPTLFGIMFAVVAGIMVFISLDELLPTAEKFGQHHCSIWGLIAGMAVMAISLLIL
jgi:Predicted divalent heavy-metal cations transporter